MRSPALALSWQLWRRHRLAFGVVGAGFFAAVATFQVLPASPEKGLHAGLASMLFAFALIYLIAIFGNGFEGPLETAGSSFPSRQFTLPVRALLLAGWPMLQALAAVVLLWTGWVWLVLQPSGFDIQPGPHALLAAAVVAVTLALLWWPFGVPWARVVGAVFILPLVALAPAFADVFDISKSWVLYMHAALIPIGACAAVIGVARARCGETPRWRWPLLNQEMGRSARRRRPFSSPARALLWFEWRRKGMWLPLAAGCWSLLLLPIVFLVEPTDEGQMRVGSNFLVLPLLAAGSLGPEMGRVGTQERPGLLAVFTATRPVSSATLVAAKLKTAALGALAAWAITLLAVSVWFFGAGLHHEVPARWGRTLEAGRGWEFGMGVPLVLLVLMLATWRCVVTGLWAGLTGRKWVFWCAMSGNAALFVGAFIWVAHNLASSQGVSALRETLPWLAWIVVALKLGLAAWFIRALDLRKLVQRSTLAKLLGLWLLVAAGLFGIGSWLIPAGFVSPGLLACGVALFLPLARLAAAPLALDWNRHR